MLASTLPERNSSSIADAPSYLLDTSGMKSISELKAHRRARIALLMEAVGQTQMAARTELAPAYLYAMSTAKGKSARGVNDENARLIEQKLQLPVGWIDGDDEVPAEVAAFEEPAISPGLARSRAANDTDALRYALGAICAVLAVNRPDEGSAIAATLKRAPKKFLAKEGAIVALIEALETGARQAKGRVRARPAEDAGS